MLTTAALVMKRSMEGAANAYMKDKEGNVTTEVAGWVVVMIFFTALFFVPILSMVEYTFFRVVPTLAMIEAPQEGFSFEPLATDETEEVLDVTKPQFITSNFRQSFRLLRAKGGVRGPFRGFWIFTANHVSVQMMSSLAIAVLPWSFTTVVASVICAQLSLGWVHIVISEPSPKPWYRRLPSLKMWKKIAVPTALCSAAEQLAIWLPVRLAVSLDMPLDLDKVTGVPMRLQGSIFGKTIGVLAFGLVLEILISIPARAVLTRVQASLLDDAEETIVPFDRSFGGKVDPEIVGGSGILSLRDAWKTFDGPARIRLVRVYAKAILLQVAVTTLAVVVIVCELSLIILTQKPPVPVDGNN